MKPVFAMTCLFLLAALPASAQEDLTSETDYFQQQAQVYQRWLDQNGVGRYMKVQELEVEPDRVTLFLGFYNENIDSVAGVWDQLKEAHEASPGPDFEEALFFRMTSLMGLDQGQAIIEIYDTYDLSREPLFFRGIYFDDNRVQIKKSDPRSEKSRYISINPKDIKTAAKSGKIALEKDYSKEKVFEQIMAFAKQKYGKSPCDQRRPAIHLKPNEDYLRFEVSDLCREVIKEAENPVICRWLRKLGYDCDWTTRELLTFTFVYLPAKDGFTLHLVLDGKVGSGYYNNVKRSGYMDMDFDFKEELEDYADLIAFEIKKHLSR